MAGYFCSYSGKKVEDDARAQVFNKGLLSEVLIQ